MKLAGIQKVTLLDYPGHIACTVFTRGCNFRCPFCHNMELVTNFDNSKDIDENEIIEFLKTRAGKLEGVCITGGEPLISDEVFSFMRKIKEIGFKIKLDTNGTFPQRINTALKEKLIDMIAMDIKSSENNYNFVAGVNVDIDKIKESISIIRNCGIDYEFRTTCVKGLHERNDFEGIGKLILGADKYYLQNFRQVENVTPDNLCGFKKEELEIFKTIVEKYVKFADIRGVD